MTLKTTKSAYAYTDVNYSAQRTGPRSAVVSFASRTRFADVEHGGNGGADGKYVGFFSFYVAAGLSINKTAAQWEPSLTPNISSSGQLYHQAGKYYRTGCDYNKWLKHDLSTIYEPSWMPNSGYQQFLSDKAITIGMADTKVDFNFALIRPNSPSTSSAEDLRWYRFAQTYRQSIPAYLAPTMPTIKTAVLNTDNFAAFNEQSTTLSISWLPSVVDELATLASYRVTVLGPNKSYSFTVAAEQTNTTIDTADLGFVVERGSIITVSVVAIDSFDIESVPSVVNKQLMSYPPGEPLNVVASPARISVLDMVAGSAINISWTAQDAGTTYRVIPYIVRGGVSSPLVSISTSTPSCDFRYPQAEINDEFVFFVNAVDIYGLASEKAVSNTVRVYGALIDIYNANGWKSGVVSYFDGAKWIAGEEIMVYDGSQWGLS